MNVISLPIKLNKLRFKVIAHSGGDSSVSVKNVFAESTASLLGNKYQMHNQKENAVSSSHDIA
jgi:hypothetical protein